MAAILSAGSASAAIFVVDARANSSSGGVAAGMIDLTDGQAFTVVVAADDMWSAGALPRWPDVNDLTGPRFTTGSDEPGEAAGPHIGADFGQHCQNGLCAAFGSPVGEINGDFRVLGTNFAGSAWRTAC